MRQAICANALPRGPRCPNGLVTVIAAGPIRARESKAMSTIANPSATRGRAARSRDGHFRLRDQRIVIRGVDRHVYDVLDEAIGEGQHIRLAYDGKDLELMTTSDFTSFSRMLLGQIRGPSWSMALDIDRVTVGETTWKTEDIGPGSPGRPVLLFRSREDSTSPRGPERKSMDPEDYPIRPRPGDRDRCVSPQGGPARRSTRS